MPDKLFMKEISFAVVGGVMFPPFFALGFAGIFASALILILLKDENTKKIE